MTLYMVAIATTAYRIMSAINTSKAIAIGFLNQFFASHSAASLARLALTVSSGTPQCGHLCASSLILVLHSGQAISGIFSSSVKRRHATSYLRPTQAFAGGGP